MKIHLKKYATDRKIAAIKGVRAVSALYPTPTQGSAKYASLLESKKLIDAVGNGETVHYESTLGGDLAERVAVAILREHGVEAEAVQPVVEVPAALLRKLRDAAIPGITPQTDWNLWDEADRVLFS